MFRTFLSKRHKRHHVNDTCISLSSSKIQFFDTVHPRKNITPLKTDLGHFQHLNFPGNHEVVTIVVRQISREFKGRNSKYIIFINECTIISEDYESTALLSWLPSFENSLSVLWHDGEKITIPLAATVNGEPKNEETMTNL